MTEAVDAGIPARLSWLQALREPQLALSWSLDEWGRVIRLARRLRLLARLGEALKAHSHFDEVPHVARRHLSSEMRLSHWRCNAITWTAQRVGDVLGPANFPCVLLKGGAYMAQGLSIGTGRLPSDLDMMVPQQHIAEAQDRLMGVGWREAELDAHDRRYYTEWSHEVPPMTHPLYGVELDLHHNILPPVARTTVDATLLLSDIEPSNWKGWSVLAPVDQILHSASHLFLDSEARDRVRDLVDLDALLRLHGARPGFWEKLPARARQIGLSEPLALAAYFTKSWLGTPIPIDALDEIEQAGPGRARGAALHWMWSRILDPTEPDAMPSQAQGAAATLQLLRYHRQRLPLRHLIPHVWHKVRAPAHEQEAEHRRE